MLTHDAAETLTSPYRRHDDAQGRYSTAIERLLAEEWVRLNRDPAAVLVVQRWARRRPVLRGAVRPADLVDAIDAGTFNDDIGFNFDSAQDGCGVGGEIGIPCAGAKEDNTIFL